jgi:hypothetical protein
MTPELGARQIVTDDFPLINEPPFPDLGWWAISGEAFLEAMKRAHAGEDPTLLYTEYYANSEVDHG